MNQRKKKKKSSVMMKEYQPYLENMLTPILEIAENFEPSEFRTHELKMRESIERQFQNENAAEIGELFIELIKNIDLVSFAKAEKKKLKNEIKERIQNDNRFLKLNQMVCEVEKKHPNISIAVFFRLNPIENFVKALEPYDLIKDFEKQSGERAARTAIRIYREVAEMLYENYIRAIHEFLSLLENKFVINSYQSFGVLVDQLPDRLKKFGYEDLIDCDSSWLRNASCHGHWKYIPQNDSIVLWDKKRPEKEFAVKELFQKAMEMYTMVIENYQPLLFLYLKRKIATDWISLLKYLQQNLTELIQNENAKIKHMEDMLTVIFKSLNEIEFKRTKIQNKKAD